MTPESLAFLGSLVERYGLPIVLLVGLGWLLLTRRLTLGSETAYVEARRVEERDGRLAAELALREGAAAITRMADSLESMTDTLLDAIEDGRARR